MNVYYEWKRLETRRCQDQAPRRPSGQGEEIHENLNKIGQLCFPFTSAAFTAAKLRPE
jgi:hypothetical protein